MKAKNQQQFTSDSDAKERLIVFVYEYLIHSGAKQAAENFKETIGYSKDIKVNEGPGFLSDWWCVFWDLYCAAPERRHTQPESSGDAQAFHDYMKMSISPQHHLHTPPQFIDGPRYGPPPVQHPRGPPPRMQEPLRMQEQPRRMQGPPPRMQGPPPTHALPHHVPPGGPPVGPPGSFIPSPGPRYAQHSGPPSQPPMMNQGQMFGPGPGQMPNDMGPSPGGSGGWQGNMGYDMNSPANQQNYPGGPGSSQSNQGPPMMMSDGGLMEVKSSPVNGVGGDQSTPHPDEYVMPGPFGQESNSQCDSAEIMKLKHSMQEDTTKMFDKEQTDFSLGEYADPATKWN